MINLCIILQTLVAGPLAGDPGPETISVQPLGYTDHPEHSPEVVAGYLVLGYIGGTTEYDTQVDHDGNGKIDGDVVVFYDLRTGTRLNQRAGSIIGRAGEEVFFFVREGRESVDLDGDGRTWNEVMHVAHLGTGSIENLGLPVNDQNHNYLASNRWFVVNGVRELPNMYAYNLLTKKELRHLPEITSSAMLLGLSETGLAAETGRRVGESRLFLYDFDLDEFAGNIGVLGFDGLLSRSDYYAVKCEASVGIDLNNDGDVVDCVPEAYEFSSRTVKNSGLAGNIFKAGEYGVGVQVSESAQGGTDLNGDSDTTDLVLHLFDVRSATPRNLGLVTADTPHVLGRWMIFGVPEQFQGTDLNMDGDLMDQVVHVYDFETGLTTNLRLAGNFSAPESRWLTLTVDEVAQGADLNQDGDAEDAVIHVYDMETGTLRNLGLAGRVHGGNNLISLIISEPSQGMNDLNNDGDAEDDVLYVYDAPSDETHNLSLAGSFLSIAGTRYLLNVPEAAQGGTDLNSDGDSNDVVLFSYNTDTKITTQLQVLESQLPPDLTFWDTWGVFNVTGPSANPAREDTSFVYVVDLYPKFRRGDANVDGELDISDAIALLWFLFQGRDLPCEDALDVDDSGALEASDVITLLAYLFADGSSPADPGASVCGFDPTPDELGCLTYPPCLP